MRIICYCAMLLLTVSVPMQCRVKLHKLVFLCRIFVNRSLNMSKIKYIGFDMDYTLAGIP